MTTDATPQSALTVQELGTYAAHCKRLVRDINFVLTDQKLKDADWTIMYAVDFSEIRHYVFPEPSFDRPPFFQDGWTGRDKDDVAIAQFNVLQHFFTTQRPIVLAEPHAVELWSFYYDTLPHLVLPRIANGLLQAIDSVSKTLSSEDSRHVIEIAENAEAGGRSLTDEEINFILNYFEQEAGHLVVFARGGELEPIDRMNNLLDNGPFVDLTDLVEFDTNAVDDALVERRYEKLKRYRGIKRKPAVSFSDALAVEHIRLANQTLEKEKKRILLLGRSKHLARTLEEEADLWQPMGPIVRHPRVFSRLYQPLPDPKMPTLDRRKASLDLLIASASTRAKREKSGPTDSTALHASEHDLDPRELIEQIQKEWSVTNSLATALEKNNDIVPRTDRAVTAAKLLEFLRNDRKLFDTAKERVAKLLTETTRKHEILAFQLQTDPTETDRGDVKYRFEFKDPNIAAVIDRLVGKSFVSSAEATELFAAGLDSTSNYERLLAMAVSLGALGRWQLTEQAAGRAVLEAEAEGVSAHEGHFVKAVAIRKQKNSPQRLGLALADLHAATTERIDAGLKSPDPRYLKEEATMKGIWSHQTLETEGDTYEDLYPPEVISRLLKQALDLTTDQKLKVEILNNFCYFYATPPTLDETQARYYLAELEKTLAAWTPDRRAWPSPIRDTVTFTHFQLAPFETTDVSKYEEWAKDLDTIPDKDFNADNLRWVKSHRRAVHDAIAKKRGIVPAKLLR
jgi:hypothetical protein